MTARAVGSSAVLHMDSEKLIGRVAAGAGHCSGEASDSLLAVAAVMLDVLHPFRGPYYYRVEMEYQS